MEAGHEILIAMIGALGFIIAAFIASLRRENTRQHQENRELFLIPIAEEIGKIRAMLEDHLTDPNAHPQVKHRTLDPPRTSGIITPGKKDR